MNANLTHHAHRNPRTIIARQQNLRERELTAKSQKSNKEKKEGKDGNLFNFFDFFDFAVPLPRSMVRELRE
jgi:hypothetical protein